MARPVEEGCSHAATLAPKDVVVQPPVARRPLFSRGMLPRRARLKEVSGTGPLRFVGSRSSHKQLGLRCSRTELPSLATGAPWKVRDRFAARRALASPGRALAVRTEVITDQGIAISCNSRWNEAEAAEVAGGSGTGSGSDKATLTKGEV